ncbi:hypothetical protein FQN55_006688 [Onygenales sp. PD_40]|nr:hypothetical protein FQN55_006688 [Onygenales sp. PD_40]
MSGQGPRGGGRGRGGDRGGGDRGGGRGGGRGRGSHPIFDAPSGGGRGRGGDRGDRGDRGGRGGRGGGFRGDRGGRGGGRGGGFRGPEVFSPSPGAVPPPPDAKVQKIEEQYKGSASSGKELSLDQLSLTRDFPLRPAYGTQGKPVLLWANYFEMVSRKDLNLHRYAVQVQQGQDPRMPSGRKLKRIIEIVLEENFGNMKDRIATDYKSMLVCRTALDNIDEETTFSIKYRQDDEDEPVPNARTYQVRVLPVGVLNVAPLLEYLASPNAGTPLGSKEEIIQALNIVLGHHPKTNKNLLSIGANKHFPLGQNEDSYDLTGALTAIRGFFVSVRAATSRLLVNVQVKATPIYSPGGLPDMIRNFLGAPTQDPRRLYRLHVFLKRVRVSVTHIVRKNKKGQVVPRIKTIYGLAHQADGRGLSNPPKVPWIGAGPKDVQFFLDGAPPAKKGKKKGGKADGKESPTGAYITVYDYFKRNYPQIGELDPRFPVVNVGTKETPNYLPAEVCQVLHGQPANSKINPVQTQNMIKFAVRTPAENARSITTSGANVLGVVPQLNAMLAGMGLSVTPNLITVPGRVLVGPSVQYKGQSSKNPQNANWNLANVAFSQGRQLPPWTYAYFVDRRMDPGALADSVSQFCATAQKQGLTVPAPLKPYPINPQGRQHPDDIPLDPIFSEIRAQSRARLVLVILPQASPAIYNKVKYRGDIKDGLHTICVVADKFMKNQPQYFANVALKFNLKLGGINHRLQPAKLGLISEGKTMVVGIDVTHPSPGSASNAPSVSGMVASVDSALAQWPATIRLQHQAKVEMVSDLEPMLQSRLRLWQKANGKLPENLLIYRDGVSEGQYGKVLEEELPLLRKACKSLYPANQKGLPRISIIIVGKRHNTRFYPTNLNDADRSSNPNNGTVVDRGVTETRNWDFFLQAHTALQGTARPAHYYIILDEIFSNNSSRKRSPQFSSIADELEDLTHNMCYLFGRATKAVSICPPAYYADLVCERARRYLSKYYEETPEPSVASGMESQAGSVPVAADLEVHPDLVDTMFYI